MLTSIDSAHDPLVDVGTEPAGKLLGIVEVAGKPLGDVVCRDQGRAHAAALACGWKQRQVRPSPPSDRAGSAWQAVEAAKQRSRNAQPLGRASGGGATPAIGRSGMPRGTFAGTEFIRPMV